MVRLSLQRRRNTFIKVVILINPSTKLLMRRIKKLRTITTIPNLKNNKISPPLMPINRRTTNRLIPRIKTQLTISQLNLHRVATIPLHQHFTNGSEFGVGEFRDGGHGWGWGFGWGILYYLLV